MEQVIVGIGISNNTKKSKHTLKWAFDKFAGEENVTFKLIHIRPPLAAIPNQMGALVALSQKQGVNKQTNEMLAPYKLFLLENKIRFEIELVESEDVVSAIASQVANDSITNLVIGASSSGTFSRLLSTKNSSAKIAECTPSYCTVYIVSKGNLAMVRSGEGDAPIRKIKDTDSFSETNSHHSSSNILPSSLTDSAWSGTHSFNPPPSPSPRIQMSRVKSNVSDSYRSNVSSSFRSNVSETFSNQWEQKEVFSGTHTPTNTVTGFKKSPRTNSQTWSDQQHSFSNAVKDQFSDNQVSMSVELERLRSELRQVQDMYVVAQSEALDNSQKIKEEAMKAEEAEREERLKFEEMAREAERERAEAEAEKQREAERKAFQNVMQKQKLQRSMAQSIQQYQSFTWEEITDATSSFSEHLIVGQGANGTVYKCTLHHTTAAAKVLNSNDGRMDKQILKELEVLSKIRHPHLLLLLGACPERGCIIYEYMDNGNLDERLSCKNDTPPIPWYDRFRIAWEVASTLVFLHNAKPKPIVHRDLKPENILLDRNLVSKIGDVGLSTMLQNDASIAATMFKNTAFAGTLCYIDPEYQRTGVVSTQSDVYAFGMVLLQLLTAKTAMALAHIVENAIREGKLMDVLDKRAGKWPIAEATDLALLALSCVELHRRDRPDLKNQIFLKLEKLKEAADNMRDASISELSAPPSHFFCPITQEIMNEPCVAADGYTYDRSAIEKWLQNKENSPMTNLPMPSKNLIPNYTLVSAIKEWNSRNT